MNFPFADTLKSQKFGIRFLVKLFVVVVVVVPYW